MNKEQYKKACSIFRHIRLIEALSANSTSSDNYLRHQHKSLCIELSAIDRHWIAKEHTETRQEADKYDNFWWLWIKFPLHATYEIEQAMKGKKELSNRTRKHIRSYLDVQVIPF